MKRVHYIYHIYIYNDLPWPLWLIWLESHPITERLWVGFLVRAHTSDAGSVLGQGKYGLGCRLTIPSPGTYRGEQLMLLSCINVFFSPVLSS